jgi:hypothetical protein
VKAQNQLVQGIPSAMYVRVDAHRGDTNTHCTALRVNTIKPLFVKHRRQHIITTHPDLELQATF